MHLMLCHIDTQRGFRFVVHNATDFQPTFQALYDSTKPAGDFALAKIFRKPF